MAAKFLFCNLFVFLFIFVFNLQPIYGQKKDSFSLNRFVPVYEAQRGIQVIVPPGLGVNISFLQTGEKVRRIWLDDLSELVIDVDEPLPDSRIIHLKRIDSLKIPFQVRARPSGNTLMTVVTDQNIYQFVLILRNTSDVQTIHITPDRDPILEIDSKTIARISHVENGLNQAIAQNRILPDSPLVLRIREFVAAVRMGQPIPQAAAQQGLFLSFIYELARLGLKHPVSPFLPPKSE